MFGIWLPSITQSVTAVKGNPLSISFDDFARNWIFPHENETDPETLYMECVTPRGLYGEYGFYMDEEALRHQKPLNCIASALYNYEGNKESGKISIEDFHPIVGDAVIGKWRMGQEGAPCLDYVDENDFEIITEYIKKAMAAWNTFVCEVKKQREAEHA